MLKHPVFLALSLFCLSLIIPMQGFAQHRPECTQVYEIITPLRAPMFGSPSIWRRMIGLEDMDRFIGSMTIDKNDLLAFGETKTKKGADILIARLNHLGRVSWEKRVQDENIRKIISARNIENQIIIAAEIENKKGQKGAGIFFLDFEGKLVRKKEFWDSRYHLFPESIEQAKGNGGYLLALGQAKNVENEYHTVLIHFSNQGNELWRRAYLIGIPNKMNSISLLNSGALIGAGHIEIDDGRKAGWLVKISEEGGMQWRRTFPRGRFSELKAVKQMRNKSFVATGDALPNTGPDSAGWVINIDEVGNPIWQRFYTGRYAYEAQDMTAEKDGRTTVLMNATPIKKTNAGRAHIRLLTLSLEGYTLRDDAYIEGAHSEAFNINRRKNGIRYIAGMAQTGYAEPSNKEDKTHTTYDAWMMAVPPLQKYVDPCQQDVYKP